MAIKAFLVMTTAFLVLTGITIVTALPFQISDPILSLNSGMVSMTKYSIPEFTNTPFVPGDATLASTPETKTSKPTPRASAAALPGQRDAQGPHQDILPKLNLGSIAQLLAIGSQGHAQSQETQQQQQVEEGAKAQDELPEDALKTAKGNKPWPSWMHPVAWTLVCYDAGIFILLMWVWVCGCVGMVRHRRNGGDEHLESGRPREYHMWAARDLRRTDMLDVGGRLEHGTISTYGRGVMLEGEMRRLGMI